jgi:hypothetical protein
MQIFYARKSKRVAGIEIIVCLPVHLATSSQYSHVWHFGCLGNRQLVKLIDPFDVVGGAGISRSRFDARSVIGDGDCKTY